MDLTRITEDDKTFIADIINAFGDGQHPFVTKDNLEYGTPNYVRQCMDKALAYAKSHKGLGEEMARTLKLKIELFS